MNTCQTIFTVALALLMLTPLACSSTRPPVMGEKAREMIGDGEDLANPALYTVTQLADKRTRGLQIVVFNRLGEGPHSGKFDWVRKEPNTYSKYLPDTLNVIVLDSREGKKGEAPTKDILTEIDASNLVPVAVTGADGTIRAVVYKPAAVGIKVFEREDGTIRIELGRRGSGRYDINYLIKLI
ncbi:MAG: hypothetical protein NTV79_09865 [Candidatus Aureabacteria bacterium]|nr:hypothetical protein [Candidatus Auribacterota bacterium]